VRCGQDLRSTGQKDRITEKTMLVVGVTGPWESHSTVEVGTVIDMYHSTMFPTMRDIRNGASMEWS
jgi:hypothetical protein